jgi:hypothetical protein
MWADVDERSHVRRRTTPGRSPRVAGPSDARLDGLLRALPPAPERLVSLVMELPLLEAALAELEDGSPDDEPALRAALARLGLEADEDRLGLVGRLRRQNPA